MASIAVRLHADGCVFVHRFEPSPLQYLVVVSTVLAAPFLFQHLLPFATHDLPVHFGSDMDEEALDCESSFLFLRPVEDDSPPELDLLGRISFSKGPGVGIKGSARDQPAQNGIFCQMPSNGCLNDDGTAKLQIV